MSNVYEIMRGVKTRPLKKGDYFKSLRFPYLDIPLRISAPYPDLRFSGGCFCMAMGIFPHFSDISSIILVIRTRFEVKNATAPCIVYASRP